MFLSVAAVEKAVSELANVHSFYLITFLTAKREKLPVGQPIDFAFGTKERDLLNDYYKPAPTSKYFYRISRVGNPSQHWLPHEFPTSGSQKSRTTTFARAFEHESTDAWAWSNSYVEVLAESKHLKQKISTFELGVWLFHRIDWPKGSTPRDIMDRVHKEFAITKQERVLFDDKLPKVGPAELFQASVATWPQLREFLGSPPDAAPDEGAVLKSLTLKQIGPATEFNYLPSERLNIITGDNSLGKTFILEVIWWTLTGEWLEQVYPRRNVPKNGPRIQFSLSAPGSPDQNFDAKFDWDRQGWMPVGKRVAQPGLVIYARFDGSFAVWDPARLNTADRERSRRQRAHIFLDREGIWRGVEDEDAPGLDRWICNGILRDWVSWQTGDRYGDRYKALLACLKELSPSEREPLVPGNPRRMPFDSREMPTLRMPYEDVPLRQASAGIQRALALAYVLVWAWFEHKANSDLLRRQPQRKLVMIIDEVEAHLHPRWQRVIIPAVMRAVETMAGIASPQLHVATHSPMVMASSETVFDESVDELHHLKMSANNVIELETLPFVKLGRVDRWLTSDVFGLDQARSIPAEKAIADAKRIQLAKKPRPLSVREIDARLKLHLSPDDDFWPRWRFFAEKFGAKG